MGCERPSGPVMDLMRDSFIKFPPNYEGELPPVESRECLKEQFFEMFRKRKLSEDEIKQALDFLEEYENRYYEDMNSGQCYHRECGGGAMVQGNLGVYCAKCGKLPDLIPPECFS